MQPIFEACLQGRCKPSAESSLFAEVPHVLARFSRAKITIISQIIK